jgi:DNA repair protein SbcD/Mre11
LAEQLNKLVEKKPFIERLFVRQHRLKPNRNLDEQISEATALASLDPKEVFKKRLQSAYPEGQTDDLLQTFDEVMELMKQAE